jgi:hypothetical protein
MGTWLQKFVKQRQIIRLSKFVGDLPRDRSVLHVNYAFSKTGGTQRGHLMSFEIMVLVIRCEESPELLNTIASIFRISLSDMPALSFQNCLRTELRADKK